LRARLAEEFGDGVDYGLLLVFAEFREDGQGEDFAGGALRLREAAFSISETFQRVLHVERDGVVDLRSDFAGGEEVVEGVAAGGADDVLVPDVFAACDLMGQDDAVDGVGACLDKSCGVEEGVVAAGHVVARVVPALDVAELDGEDGALEAVHAGVPTDFVVVVAAAHAVLTEHFGALGQLAGVRSDHAGIAGGTEVFGGIEAEGGDIAKSSGFDSTPLRAPSLGCVFDEREAALLADTGEGGPVGALTEEVNWQDGADGFSLGSVEGGFDGGGGKVEGCLVDIGECGCGPGAKDGADGGEKAEWGGENGGIGTDSGGGEGEPEGIGTGRAADCVGYPELPGCGLLKCSDLLSQDKLLRLKHMAYGGKQFPMKGLVLAFEVEHRDGCGRGRCGLGGIPGRNWAILHLDILPTMEAVVRHRVRAGTRMGILLDGRRG